MLIQGRNTPINKSPKHIGRAIRLSAIYVLVAVFFTASSVSAITQQELYAQGIYFVTLDPDLACNAIAGSINISGSGTDILGQLPAEAKTKFDAQYPKIEAMRAVYEDQSAKNNIPWQIFAALHYREANNGPDQTVLNGQPYGAVNSDGQGLIDTPDQAYRKSADLIRGLSSVYGVPEVSNSSVFGVQDLAKIGVSYNRGALYKNAYGQEEGPWQSPYVASYIDNAHIDMVFPGPDVNGVTVESSLAGKKDTRLGFVPFLLLLYEKTGANTDTIAGANANIVSNDPSSPCNRNGNAIGASLSDVVYYSQRGSKWADYPYPFSGDPNNEQDNTLIFSGCGPTTMAMVASTLTGDSSITPAVMADKNITGGHRVESGTSWSAFTKVLPEYGLTVENIGTDVDRLATELKTGALAIGSYGPGPFTSGGHILMIRSVTDNGDFLIADPNDGNEGSANYLKKSKTSWSAADISGSAKSFFIVRNP